MNDKYLIFFGKQSPMLKSEIKQHIYIFIQMIEKEGIDFYNKSREDGVIRFQPDIHDWIINNIKK